ncbi:MAG TPA: DNA polymerase III subunit alpha [Gemmataceae bacterium]|nr:DNA polymerase III subunit alpha [Gemmataceae bacterium]
MPVPLHTHSWYSLLEGVAAPEALLERAAACGYTALALTDTNNLYGAVPFTERAHQYGVRPLLGACLRQHRTRCVALVAERVGYRSLCRILSRLHLGCDAVSDVAAPRLAELLADNADGLHVLVSDAVLAERLREAFGPRLWLELVRPARSEKQEQELIEMGRRLDLRPVASTAVHFATAAEHPAFRLVTAVRQTTLLDRMPGWLPVTPAHHLVDPATLWRRFRDLPEAVRNTDALAEQVRSDVLPRDVILPAPRVPRSLSATMYLRHLCERGLRRRGAGNDLAARQRLREELAVIEAQDLAGYFLVVRDIARYARRQHYGMALRGSAGNSLVCFLLEITDVDPLRFHLPMERFLHPGRTDLPDIDLDFDWKIRDDVLAHVFRRHGPRHTAMISSHLFLQPRSAFREAAKVHGLSNEQVSRLLETLSQRVSDLLGEEGVGSGEWGVGSAECPAGFPLEAERWPRIVSDARLLLGRPHHLSIHPGGVVITPRPVEDYVPLQRAAKGVVITQFEKDAAEHIGLVKIDLLGNRGVSTVDEALSQVGGRQAVGLDRDPATVALLQNGGTVGVNQLESPAMRHLLIQMRPEGLDDVIQALALIRPGAAGGGRKKQFIRRRRGLEPVTYGHPRLEHLLHETQGLMIYEDDALRVVQALTDWPAPAADRFRKRVAKRRTDAEARELAGEFLEACARNGVPRAVAADQWVQLAGFHYYTFCKSHAVSYGLIAWTAAFLKTHHPVPFWTAALNNNQGVYPRRVYVEAIKRAGIAVRLPCVNRSAGPFRVEDDAIRTGLDAVAGLDGEVRARVLADRAQHGPYGDLADFRRRVAPPPEALALLIHCGALDFTGRPRPALFLEADLEDREKGGGNASALLPFAFGLSPGDSWSPADYAAERRLRDEWELLGFVAGPPLFSLFRPRLPPGLITSRQLREHLGRRVHTAGLVAAARHTPTSDGRTMQFVTLEDEWGLMEVTLFPGLCPAVAYLTLGPYLVSGTVEEDHGVVSVTAASFRLYAS